MDVIETDVAEVELDDEGVPSNVNNYKVTRLLGEGSFSKVYLCQKPNGEQYALKVLNKSFLKRKREYKRVNGKMIFCSAFQKVQREVAIMKKLSHRNLVKLYEIIDSPEDDKMFLVLEFIEGGQVMHWEDKTFSYRCRTTESGVLDKSVVRQCMRDVVYALEYLHANQICHRDIKPENVLLANGSVYKLADFGVAHMHDGGDKNTLRSTEGTYYFLAPECTTGDEYDPYKVDIWALGVTMFVMLGSTLPFGTKAASLAQVMDSIREDPLVFPPSMDPECVSIMQRMMEKDPERRITLDELKRHPWLEAPHDRVSVVCPVEVTDQEIEAAFIPGKNFIMMARLKIRMSSRLAKARNLIESRGGPRTSPTKENVVVAVSNHHHQEGPSRSEVPPVELHLDSAKPHAAGDHGPPGIPSHHQHHPHSSHHHHHHHHHHHAHAKHGPETDDLDHRHEPDLPTSPPQEEGAWHDNPPVPKHAARTSFKLPPLDLSASLLSPPHASSPVLSPDLTSQVHPIKVMEDSSRPASPRSSLEPSVDAGEPEATTLLGASPQRPRLSGHNLLASLTIETMHPPVLDVPTSRTASPVTTPRRSTSSHSQLTALPVETIHSPHVTDSAVASTGSASTPRRTSFGLSALVVDIDHGRASEISPAASPTHSPRRPPLITSITPSELAVSIEPSNDEVHPSASPDDDRQSPHSRPKRKAGARHTIMLSGPSAVAISKAANAASTVTTTEASSPQKQPSVSPLREPSVMLPRRKSALPGGYEAILGGDSSVVTTIAASTTEGARRREVEGIGVEMAAVHDAVKAHHKAQLEKRKSKDLSTTIDSGALHAPSPTSHRGSRKMKGLFQRSSVREEEPEPVLNEAKAAATTDSKPSTPCVLGRMSSIAMALTSCIDQNDSTTSEGSSPHQYSPHVEAHRDSVVLSPLSEPDGPDLLPMTDLPVVNDLSAVARTLPLLKRKSSISAMVTPASEASQAFSDVLQRELINAVNTPPDTPTFSQPGVLRPRQSQSLPSSPRGPPTEPIASSAAHSPPNPPHHTLKSPKKRQHRRSLGAIEVPRSVSKRSLLEVKDSLRHMLEAKSQRRIQHTVNNPPASEPAVVIARCDTDTAFNSDANAVVPVVRLQSRGSSLLSPQSSPPKAKARACAIM